MVRADHRVPGTPEPASPWARGMDGARARGLRIWIQDGEGASFWAHVCARSGQQGGARGVLIVCCDGPAGLPEAVEATWPDSMVPTCVVHPGPRHPCGSSPTGTARGSPPPGARACTAPDEEAARRALDAFRQSDPGRKYPQTAATWERAWERFIPFLAFPPALRRVIYTTNAIESLNHRAARSAENRGHFPSDEAAVKLLWPAGLQHRGPPGRGARQGEEHARPLAQGQRVDSSTGRVTTNRSAPPAGPPGSPPPTPTESTPTSDRTRLHRNIDRLARAAARPGICWTWDK